MADLLTNGRWNYENQGFSFSLTTRLILMAIDLRYIYKHSKNLVNFLISS
jgi:hypothetical protein